MSQSVIFEIIKVINVQKSLGTRKSNSLILILYLKAFQIFHNQLITVIYNLQSALHQDIKYHVILSSGQFELYDETSSKILIIWFLWCKMLLKLYFLLFFRSTKIFSVYNNNNLHYFSFITFVDMFYAEVIALKYLHINYVTKLCFICLQKDLKINNISYTLKFCL